MKTLTLTAVAALIVATQPMTNAAPSMTEGTWHVGLSTLWGGTPGDDRTDKKLDIYPMFQDGKVVNALATARRFNTSIHFLEESTVVADPVAKTLKGAMKFLITPDLWVPQDGLSFVLEVTIDGQLKPQDDGKITLGGRYTARRADGQPIHDDKKVVEGNLIGTVGETDPTWGNAVLKAGMSQEVPPGTIDMDAIEVTLGVADGKVQYGLIGLSAQAKWPAPQAVPFSVENFGPVSDSGIAKGSFVVSGRHLHVGGDPKEKYQIDFTMQRVQGLCGGRAVITKLDADGKPTSDVRRAAGRGGATRGGGDVKSYERVLWRHDFDERPWWVPVAGFAAPQPGEHPRLLFRKADLPALRQRAQTPEGKAIIERLRVLLGNNGEALPTQFSAEPPHNHRKTKAAPPGTFTTWHAAGFGFLYQLTGDKKYADLAKGCVEFMLAGKNDVDNRYSWWKPGADMRCGSVLGAMAYAYDFCYDAWPEEFRKKIALEIQNFSKITASEEEDAKAKGRAPEPTTIEKLSGRTGYPPGSNHYGSLIGGTGVAMLAIKGDPGVNTPWVEQRLAEIESNMPRMLTMGFGDAGYYSEGFPPSRLSAEGGFLELMQATRVAAGKDYINAPRPNANWLTLRWVAHMGGAGYAQVPSRGTYGGDYLEQDDLRGSFALGFGAVSDQYRPALLWTYKTFIEPFEAGKFGTTGDQKTWNALTYPHYCFYSFLNWPIGKEPQNPATVLPLTAVDHIHGYFITRNRWQDKDDIIVTHLLEYGPKGYYEAKDGPASGRAGRLRIWGNGIRTQLDAGTGSPTHYVAGKDGSFLLTAGSNTLAVDMSQASGADLVIVAVGAKEAGKAEKGITRQAVELTVGDKKSPAVVLVLAETAPAIKADGNKVTVGGQSFEWDGAKIVPAVFQK